MYFKKFKKKVKGINEKEAMKFSAMIWLCPQDSQVKTLTPNMMVLEGGTFGRWLDYESGAN